MADAHLKHVVDMYHHYVQNVSSEVMAISENCAIFLYRKIKEVQPAAVADLGSGFSTFVMFMATPPHVPICVIDSSRTWLARTREFCALNVPRALFNRPTVYWLRIDAMDPDAVDAQEIPVNFKADFVFFDIDAAEYRSLYLPILSRITRPGSIICFDDLHKPCMVETVYQFYAKWRKTLPPVQLPEIKDKFGRYQALATCVA